jgi:uncharacterized protein (UPF0303 family)
MDSKTLAAEAADCHLSAFAEDEALRLGNLLVQIAQAADCPVVINIRTANRTLFHVALPGSTPLNDRWALRKSNTALLFAAPSFLVGCRNLEKGESLDRHGLCAADYADAGGAVPLFVAGTLAAVVTVSGLPQAEDHALVMRAIRAFKAR